MMKQLRLDYPTSVLSRMLVVSASGYYAWVDRPPSKRAREEVRLELEIKAAHKRTRRTYGPERLQRDLAEHGVRVGIGRIKRIRKKLGIRCKQKRRFKATTQSRHRLSVAGNVLGQQFKVYRPNAVWVTDITYVPTDEGWLYLAGHKDLFTGEIVGYAMGERLSKNLVSQSLLRALSSKATSGTPPRGYQRPLFVRGPHYLGLQTLRWPSGRSGRRPNAGAPGHACIQPHLETTYTPWSAGRRIGRRPKPIDVGQRGASFMQGAESRGHRGPANWTDACECSDRR